jgi:hypothetical protein
MVEVVREVGGAQQAGAADLGRRPAVLDGGGRGAGPGRPPAPSHSTRASRDPADLPTAVVAGAWITIMLVLFGAPAAGLAVAVATALGWVLWRSWPQLSRQRAPKTSPDGGKDRMTRGAVDEPGHRRPRRTWNAR